MGKDYLLELQDGEIISIESDNHISLSCPTCDYKNECISFAKITLVHLEIIIDVIEGREHSFTEETLMKIILPQTDKIKKMKEFEFAEWLRDELRNVAAKIYYRSR